MIKAYSPQIVSLRIWYGESGWTRNKTKLTYNSCSSLDTINSTDCTNPRSTGPIFFSKNVELFKWKKKTKIMVVFIFGTYVTLKKPWRTWYRRELQIRILTNEIQLSHPTPGINEAFSIYIMCNIYTIPAVNNIENRINAITVLW